LVHTNGTQHKPNTTKVMNSGVTINTIASQVCTISSRETTVMYYQHRPPNSGNGNPKKANKKQRSHSQTFPQKEKADEKLIQTIVLAALITTRPIQYLALGHRVVDIDGREQKRSTVLHLVQALHTSGSLLRNSNQSLHHLMVLLGILLDPIPSHTYTQQQQNSSKKERANNKGCSDERRLLHCSSSPFLVHCCFKLKTSPSLQREKHNNTITAMADVVSPLLLLQRR